MSILLPRAANMPSVEVYGSIRAPSVVSQICENLNDLLAY